MSRREVNGDLGQIISRKKESLRQLAAIFAAVDGRYRVVGSPHAMWRTARRGFSMARDLEHDPASLLRGSVPLRHPAGPLSLRFEALS